MKIRCLFFASLREKIQTGEMELEMEKGTAKDAADLLRLLHPGAASDFDRLAMALNERYCKPDAELTDGDVLAFIPPVSGGGS
ncbi:MAG: molybdopterin converting factor subunit 1 [Candidatus Omnitrophota bacterium]